MNGPGEIKPGVAFSDYLAAEPTVLAWIRTGLALMGFGFVVARFGLSVATPSHPTRALCAVLRFLRVVWHRSDRIRSHRKCLCWMALFPAGREVESRRNNPSLSVNSGCCHGLLPGIGGTRWFTSQ